MNLRFLLREYYLGDLTTVTDSVHTDIRKINVTSVIQLNKTGTVHTSTFVTLKCIHVTVVAGKSNKYYIF
jgi:hypothetical protein